MLAKKYDVIRYDCKESIKIANKMDRPIVKYDFSENNCFKENRIDSSNSPRHPELQNMTDEQIFEFQKPLCNLSIKDFVSNQCKSAIAFVNKHGSLNDIIDTTFVLYDGN